MDVKQQSPETNNCRKLNREEINNLLAVSSVLKEHEQEMVCLEKKNKKTGANKKGN